MASQCIYGGSNEGGENGDRKEGRYWRLPGLLYANEFFLCGESKENLRAMVRWFVDVCRGISMKVSAGKIKVMVLNGEEGLECEVYVDGFRLEHVLELKYLGCVFGRIRYMWGRV